jgi:hypothetical protein
MKFKFKNYCLILMGVKDNLIDDILKVSETTVSVMGYNSQDVIVATFSSNLNVNEITEYVKTFDVNFFIFELDKNCGFNIKDKKTSKDLFGFINDKQNIIVKPIKLNFNDLERGNENYNEMRSHLKNLREQNTNKVHSEAIFIDDLNEEEIENEINKILDKGYKKIGKKDKLFIQKLMNKL